MWQVWLLESYFRHSAEVSQTSLTEFYGSKFLKWMEDIGITYVAQKMETYKMFLAQDGLYRLHCPSVCSVISIGPTNS